MATVTLRLIPSEELRRTVRPSFVWWSSTEKKKTLHAFAHTKQDYSLRKEPTFCDATSGLPAKLRLRNERRNTTLMTCHYLDLGSASDWLHVPPPKWSPPSKWSPPPKWPPITTEMIPIRNRNDPVINFRNLGLNGLGTLLSILNSSFIHANTILNRGK